MMLKHFLVLLDISTDVLVYVHMSHLQILSFSIDRPSLTKKRRRRRKALVICPTHLFPVPLMRQDIATRSKQAEEKTVGLYAKCTELIFSNFYIYILICYQDYQQEYSWQINWWRKQKELSIPFLEAIDLVLWKAFQLSLLLKVVLQESADWAREMMPASMRR